MLCKGFNNNFSTKKETTSDSFSPEPHQGALPLGPPSLLCPPNNLPLHQTCIQGWHSCASARHRPFVFSLDAQVSTLAYHYASTRTHMHSQLSINVSCKITDNVPFLSTKLSKYSVKCSKLAGELANRSKLLPIISDLSQDLVFSHHRHDINKAKAWCLLAGNYPS